MNNNSNIQSEVTEDSILDSRAFSLDLIFSDKELSIYNSLKLIRPELAGFYKDGLYIKKYPFESKSYILAHLLREIDGGLRDVFEKQTHVIEVKCEKCGKIEKKLVDNAFSANAKVLFDECKKEYDTFEYLKGITLPKFKKYSGHAYSILSSFHLSINEPIAKEYIMIAIWFHKYAHRNCSGDFSPRRENDILKMWGKFEAVLYELFNSIKYEHIDSILTKTNPSAIDIQKVYIIQQTDLHKNYFWGKLIHLGWLEPLYREGYFAGANNPTPVFDETTKEYKAPTWVELLYIQNVTWQMSQNPDADFSIILNIIDDICSYKDSNEKRIANHNTDSVIIFLISVLPPQAITRKHFNYLTAIFKSENGSQYSHDFQKRFIDKFIATNDKKNLLLCLSVILLYRKDRGPFESYRSLLDRYFLHEFIDEKSEDIIRICGLEGFKVVEKVLKIVSRDHWHSIKAIEDHYQNGQDLDDFSHQVVRFVREYLLKLPYDEKLIQIISDYLHKEKITIYPRIAYFIISSRYEELSHLFWAEEFNPLKSVSNDHELFELLNKHSPTFDKEQIRRVLEWIKEEDDYFEFNGEKHPSQSKKLWLTALLKTEDSAVITEYEKVQKIYPHKIEHPGFSGWMESVFGHVSPLDSESVQKMGLTEIIDYYTRYEEKPLQHRSITDPTIDGLSDVIKLDIKNNISKYTLNIDVIATAPIGFQYSWIMGLWQYSYENKAYLDSNDVLSLIYRIISSESFRKNYAEDESLRNRTRWFTHRVLCLLNCGLDCHGNMFSTENLPIVKNILLEIYENDHNTEPVNKNDITNQYINSYSGELYDALIEYNVVSAYASTAPIEARWDSDIKQILEAGLSKEQKNPLFYYALGKGYYSLYWIDKSWLDKTQAIRDNDNWVGFMVGFHLHNNTVTQVFEEFCNNGQYDRFFANRKLFDAVTQKIVIHYICTAYHYEKINFELDSPLLVSVINGRHASDYENIIQFFDINDNKSFAGKIRDLWRFMFDINKDLDCEVSKYFIGESYRWLDCFDDIDDEIKQWILLSVKNLQPFSASQAIKRLNLFTEKNPTQVGELLLALVSSESKVPLYSDLEKIVEKLFESGNKEIAKHIANECLRKGHLGLREIVSKYS